MDPVAAAANTSPGSQANGIDLDRLESAVRDLTERFVAQRDEAAKLRGEIAMRDRRVEELEAEMRRLQQARREVARRIDDLIEQIGKLEARTVAAPEAP